MIGWADDLAAELEALLRSLPEGFGGDHALGSAYREIAHAREALPTSRLFVSAEQCNLPLEVAAEMLETYRLTFGEHPPWN